MERSKPTRFNGTTWKDLDEAPLALFSKAKVSITPLEWKTKQPCKAAIKYGINMYNALCQESVEPCKFCAKIFSNKLDALVHNATHSTVSLKRSKKLKSRKNSVINNISLDLTNGINGVKCNGYTVNAEKKERAKKSPLHDAACCPKDNSENVTITDGFRLPKPRDMSCYYKQMIKVRRPKTEANRDKAQGNPLVMDESSNKLEVLINCVADCKVNLEPMICDSDCQTLLQKTAEWTKSNANLFPPTFTTNNSSKSSKRTVETDDRTCIAPDILSSFTNECRVVLDNPLLNLPIPEAKVSNMEVVKPDRLLDSFTAECKVILGPQMIFDDDPSGGKLPSSSQLDTEDLPAASADLSDDDEPLVNVLDLNDYSSLIKPLICYCTFCPQVFPNRYLLLCHETRHLYVALPQYTATIRRTTSGHCINCNLYFTSAPSYLNHVITVHAAKQLKTCLRCQVVYTGEVHLHKHLYHRLRLCKRCWRPMPVRPKFCAFCLKDSSQLWMFKTMWLCKKCHGGNERLVPTSELANHFFVRCERCACVSKDVTNYRKKKRRVMDLTTKLTVVYSNSEYSNVCGNKIILKLTRRGDDERSAGIVEADKKLKKRCGKKGILDKRKEILIEPVNDAETECVLGF